MKRGTLLSKIIALCAVLLLTISSSAQIWVAPITSGQPLSGTYYLGDKINPGSSWYFQFEIGQASWNSSQVGIGQNSDGTTGWNYADATWYQDGSGSNKKVQRNIAEFQFTATGTWYVVGRAKANSGDAYTYADETSWTNNQAFSTTNASYWSVFAMSSPSSQSASGASSSTNSLSWTKWNGKNVMIVRSTTNSFTTPTNGTAYSVGSSIGSGTVVYNSSGTSFTDNSLSASTTYYYAFYSENYSYYSSSVTTSATTLTASPTITSSVGVVASSPGSGTSGYVGNTITINGTNLNNVTTVKVGGVNGTAVSIVSQTSTSLTFTAINAGGQIYVANAGGSATSTETYTNLGYITTTTGDWNTNGTWLNGAIPPASSTVTVAHDLTLNGTVSNSPTSVTVNSGKSLSFGASGTATISTLTINGTVSMTSGGTLTIAASGTFTNNATFTRGAGTVNFAGAGTVNGSVATTFNNVTINTGGLTLSTIPSIDGTFQINGGYVVSNAPKYTSNSTLFYNSSYNRSNEWNATGVGTLGTTAGYPNHVTINTGTFSVLNADAGTARAMAGNLTIVSGATFTTGALNALVTVGGNITNNGTVTMSTSTGRIKCANFTNASGASTTLSSNVGGDLELTGSLIDNATFNANTRAVFFTGSGVQDVSGSGTFNIDYIVMNKPSGRVRMLNDLLCEGPNGGNALSFTSSTDTLDLNGYLLTLGKVGVSSTVTGSGVIKGGSTSTLRFLGDGAFGTILFDQSTPGTTNLLSSLTLDRSSSGSVTLGSNVTLGGLTLTNGTLNAGSNTITYTSNSITRTSGNINASSGTIAFTNSSSLSMPASLFSGNVNNMTLNGAGGVSMGSDLTLNGTLTLTNGLLTLGSNHLTLGSSASVSGTPSASNMIVATGSGTLRKIVTGTGNFTFPIGDNTGTAEYSPVNVNMTSGTFGAGAYISANVTNTKHPSNVSSDHYLNRYWSIEQSGVTGFTAVVTGTYTSDDVNGTEANILMGKWSGSLPWTRYTSSINTGTKQLTSGTVSSFSSFTGISSSNPTVSITPTSNNFCLEGSSTLNTSATGDPTLTYLWTPGGATTSSISVSPSTTTKYKVTVTDGNGMTVEDSVTITVLSHTSSDTTASACTSFSWHGNTYTSSGDKYDTLTNAAGCDSVITLHLTIRSTSSSSTSHTACDSYTWNGNTYTTSGSYTFTGTNAVGCDSIAVLTLTINSSNASDTTASVCTSFIWHGTTYTTSGDKYDTLTNANGCDSVVTLHLTIRSTSSSSSSHTACNSYVWNGNTYNTSGSYTFNGTNEAGCDSTAILNLTINSSNASDTSASACTSFAWHGTTYTTSGDKYDTLTNANGCDSVVTLHLTIRSTSSSSSSHTACNSYVWNGNTYTTSGSYTFNGTNAAGCDSTAVLDLTINSSSASDTSATVCDSFVWHGITYTTSGDKYDTLTNEAGCDSIVTLHLTIKNSTESSVTHTACNSYLWNGTTYSNSGTYSYTTSNAVGCDSVAVLNLTINTNTAFDTTVTACDSYVWRGITYTTSGDKKDTISNVNGCDSVITLHLTINTTTHNSIYDSACESYVWHGITRTTSGTYLYSYNDDDCPSVDTLHLTIYYGTHNDTTATACESFEWRGVTYTNSGTYANTYTNENGCASADTLRLTINNGSHNVEYDTACGSFSWHSISRTTTGMYTYSYTNGSGCPSVDTLYLIINNGTSTDTTATVCESITWRGTTYTTSGDYAYTYNNEDGCASVDSLHLTVNYGTHEVDTVSACETYTWHENEYTTSGTYTYGYTNASNCPSVDTLKLTILNGTHNVQYDTACESFTWHGVARTTSGTYTRSYTGANGCPSVDTLFLIINNGASTDTTATVCESITWRGTTYTTSGDYAYTYYNEDGCASVDSLHLTVNYGTHEVDTVSACETYTWHENEYTTSGTYTYGYTNASNCPSVDTLKLTILNGTHNVQYDTACESFTWHGVARTTSGTYTRSYTGANGCPSVDTLFLIINNGTSTDTTATVCESITWRGTTYTTSGDYAYTYNNEDGCASVDSLHLTVNYGTHNDTTVVACESFNWNGTAYTSSGTYTYSYTNDDDCPSVDTLHLTVNYGTHNSETQTACGSYTWHGTSYNVTDVYTYAYTNGAGCASVDTLHLTINNGADTDTTATVCESITWRGNTYTTSGDYAYTYTDANGCASVDSLHLTVNYGTHNDTTVVACESYTWNGAEYTASGTYTYGYTNDDDCPSVDTLHLTVNYGTHNSETQTACGSYTWHGTSYNVTDVYTYAYTNGAGCASVDTLHLTINNGADTDTTATVCESITWRGNTYTTSGDYAYTYTDANGCASVDSLHLTVNYGTHNDTTVVACESYTWNGAEYTASGTYTYGYTNDDDCPSVDTLHLTVNYGTHNSETQTACESYTWHGTEYTETGDYEYSYNNGAGCASVDTLHLTINVASSTTITETVCNSFTLNDSTYTVTGIYTQHLLSATGCDSTITLDLTINHDGDTTITVSACESYTINDSTYTTSGTYVQHIESSTGCDSTITINLTIYGLPAIDVITGDSVLCKGTTVTLGNTVSGGVWSIDDTTIATINSLTGVMHSVNLGTATVTYTVTSIHGCSNAATMSILVNDIPNIAAITGTSTICLSSSSQLSNDVPDGVWSSSDAGIVDVDATGLITGVTTGNALITYTVTDISTGCINQDTLQIYVGALPSAPDTVYGPRELCAYINQPTQILYHVNPASGANSYDWYVPTGVTIVSGQGNDSLWVTVDSTLYRWAPVYVASVSAGGCTSSYVPFWILKTMPTLGNISGSTNVCPNINVDTVYYTIDTVSFVTSYQWEVPSGATIVSGQGTNTIGVTFTNSYVTGGYIRVTALSNCGSRPAKSIRVFKQIPATPGVISGATNACPYYNNGTNVTYSVDSVAYAASYTWTVPSGMTVISGQGTRMLTVRFDSGFVTSTLKVKAVSNCYTSADRTLTITASPFPTPGTILGPTNACSYINTGTATYYINKLSGPTSYIWTVPAGVNITGHPAGTAENDTIITVTFNSSFVSGSKIQVQSSGCNVSAASLLTIIKAIPTTPVTIIGRTNVCSAFPTPTSTNSDTVIYRTNSVSGASNYIWTITTNIDSVSNLVSTDTFIVVRFRAAFTTGTITVKSNSPCGISSPRSLSITKLIAAQPGVIQKSFVPSVLAITNVANIQYDTLRIRKVLNATSYNWTMKLGTNATITHLNALGANDTAIVVNILTGFVRDTVSVNAVTSCNISAARVLILTALTVPPNVTAVSGSNSPCIGDTLTYTVTPPTPTGTQSAPNRYRWTLPANSSITYSNSDSSVIKIRYATGFIGGIVSVKAVSAAGILSTTAYSITLRYLPATPSNITTSTGNYNACIGSSITYTVVMPVLTTTQRTASVYRWTKPTFTTITSAASDSSTITLRYDAGYTSGTITVKAQTACGLQSTAKSVALTFPLPPVPLSVTSSTGNMAGCIGGTRVYTATAGTPATGQVATSIFRWTRPANTTIVSANGDSSQITLQFNIGYTSGALSARAQSACGALSTAKSVTLIAPYLPPMPTTISSGTGNLNACVGASITYTATAPSPTATQNAISVYRWTIPANTSVSSANSDSSAITLSINAGFVGGTLSVRGQSACGTISAAKTVTLTHSGCPAGTIANPVYSKITNEEQHLGMTVFPNPSTTQFTVNIKGITNAKLTAKLVDLQGRVLMTWQTITGNQLVVGNELKSGTYILQMSDGKQIVSSRLLKY